MISPAAPLVGLVAALALAAPRARPRCAPHENWPGDLALTVQLACSGAEHGQTVAAIKALERARTRYPKMGAIRRLLGVLYQRTGQRAKATVAFSKAVGLAPKDADAWSDLAAVLEKSGAYDAALRAENKALALRPHDAGIRADRAIIFYRLGRLSEAIRDGEHAHAALPKDVDLMHDLALMSLDRGDKPDVQRATELLRSAHHLAPEDAGITLAYAQALLAASKNREAGELFGHILARNPRQAWAAWGQGLLAWRDRDLTTARRAGLLARGVLPHVFRLSGYNPRQFHSPDARPYLHWLDTEHGAPVGQPLHPPPALVGRPVLSRPVLGRPVLSRPTLSRPTLSRPMLGRPTLGRPVLGRPVLGPPRLDAVRIEDGCAPPTVKRHLADLRRAVTRCFGEDGGQVRFALRLDHGRPAKVRILRASAPSHVVNCIANALGRAYVPGATCTIKATWRRAVAPLPSRTAPARQRPATP